MQHPRAGRCVAAGRPALSLPARARHRDRCSTARRDVRRTAAPRSVRRCGPVPASAGGRPARREHRSASGAGCARRPRHRGPLHRPKRRGSRAPRRPCAAAAPAPRRPTRRHSPAAGRLRSCPRRPSGPRGRPPHRTRRRRPRRRPAAPANRRPSGVDERGAGQRPAQVVEQLAQVGPCLGGARVRPQLASEHVAGHAPVPVQDQPRHQPLHPRRREHGYPLPVHDGPDLAEQSDHDTRAS